MIKLFIKYLRNPEYVYSPDSLSIKDSIALIGKSILIYLGFILLSSIIVILPIKLLNLVPVHILKDLPLTFKILILVPFYEELAFRLPLRFSAKNIFISIGTLLFLILNKSFNIYLSLGIALLIASIPFLKVIRVGVFNKMQNYFLKYYKFIFYFLSIIFGLLHLFGFKELSFMHFLISPLLVINQIFLGFLLSYIRVNYRHGFIYCFLLHALINLIFLVPKNLF